MYHVWKKHYKYLKLLNRKELFEYQFHFFTLRICQVFCVSEANSNSQAQYHKHPINFWYVYLTMYCRGCMHNLHSRKTT